MFKDQPAELRITFFDRYHVDLVIRPVFHVGDFVVYDVQIVFGILMGILWIVWVKWLEKHKKVK
jgi:hypothetical protein